MTIGTLRVEGRKFRVIPEEEFRVLCRQAKAGLAARRQPAGKGRKVGTGPRTLKQMNQWMSNHWDEVLSAAKSNTKHLTGREVL